MVEMKNHKIFHFKGSNPWYSTLKAFSWETNLWVTLGVFKVRRRKTGKGNLYLTENRFSINELLCTANNHNYVCHICAKGILDSNLNEAVIDKISNFHEIASNFTYSQKSYFLKYNWNFLWQGHVRIFFGRLWALKEASKGTALLKGRSYKHYIVLHTSFLN